MNMNQSLLFVLTFFLVYNFSYSQKKKHETALGFSYGYGSEFKNNNFTYTNNLYKLQYFHQFTTSDRKVKWGLLLQPEVNFATHQLINPYFIKPSDPDYIQKTEEYTKLKHLREFAFNIGFTARTNLSKNLSTYLLISSGPLYNETETERLANGLAFSDVFGIGFSYKTPKVLFDIRPVLRHVSNAGTQHPNSGITTKNIEFAVSFPL